MNRIKVSRIALIVISGWATSACTRITALGKLPEKGESTGGSSGSNSTGGTTGGTTSGGTIGSTTGGSPTATGSPGACANGPAEHSSTTPGPVALAAATNCLRQFHIASTGSDNNDGSVGAPFLTIQKAAAQVQAGDCVFVHAANGSSTNYAGFGLSWDNPQTGTAAHPIIFQADPGVVITSRYSQRPSGINLEPGSDYVHIINFEVENGGTITEAGIRATGAHTCVAHNKSNGNGEWGIFTAFNDGATVEFNITSNSQNQHGIYISNTCDNPIVRGNVSFGNAGCGLHFNGDASQGGRGTIIGALVEDNIIHDNGTAGGSAINMDGAQNGTIRNNLIYANHANGIALFQTDAADGARNNVVVNNTFLMSADSRWAVNISSSPGNAVYNNILYNANPSHGSIEIAADSLSGFLSDYNLVVNALSTDSGDSAMSLASWRSATGQDQHSQIISNLSALFINLGGNDYHLAPGSAAINAGTTTDAPSTDLDGNARPNGTAVDIGAYESPQ